MTAVSPLPQPGTGLSTNVWALGTFSIAGARPFVGLVFRERVIALNALEAMARALGQRFGRCTEMLELMDDWDVNEPALMAISEWLHQYGWAHTALVSLPVPLELLRVHAPVEQPRQFFCSGANYRQHVYDLIVDQARGDTVKGMTLEQRKVYANDFMDRRGQSEPYIFNKVNSSITGPYDPIPISNTVEQPDWELELAVVIGRPGYQLTEDNAMDVVAGYTLVNDITNRELVHREDLRAIGTDWLMGKSLPGYSPMGPFIIPASQVSDPHNLQIQLRLNGELMQDESTADMIFPIPRLLSYLTQRIRLYPGDILITGSPAGNGSHYNRFLRPGDRIDSTIEGLGWQSNKCVVGA